MIISGDLVRLRALEINDVPLLNKWANSKEIWDNLGGWHFPYSISNTENWVLSLHGNNKDNQIFGIETTDLGLIGTANLLNIDWKNRNAFHGMMIGCIEARGKGYALDTVKAIMEYAFLEMGLQRLDGDIIETNSRSIKFYTQKCGWDIEGKKENWFYRKGNYYDKILLGITRNKYLEMYS